MLRQVSVLSYGVDHDWVLLSLLFEEIICGDLGKAEDIGEVRVLVSSELSDVTLRNFLESELLLHFFQILGPLALSGLIEALALFLLLFCANSLEFLWRMFVLPLAFNIVCQFP